MANYSITIPDVLIPSTLDWLNQQFVNGSNGGVFYAYASIQDLLQQHLNEHLLPWLVNLSVASQIAPLESQGAALDAQIAALRVSVPLPPAQTPIPAPANTSAAGLIKS